MTPEGFAGVQCARATQCSSHFSARGTERYDLLGMHAEAAVAARRHGQCDPLAGYRVQITRLAGRVRHRAPTAGDAWREGANSPTRSIRAARHAF